MIYHDEYIVESFSTTTKQSYYILLGDFQKGKTKRGLSQINNALSLYLRNQGVAELLTLCKIVCCIVRERVNLDSRKSSGKNLCENGFTDSPHFYPYINRHMKYLPKSHPIFETY